MHITCTFKVPYLGEYNAPWTRESMPPELYAELLARGVPADSFIVHDAPSPVVAAPQPTPAHVAHAAADTSPAARPSRSRRPAGRGSDRPAP